MIIHTIYVPVILKLLHQCILFHGRSNSFPTSHIFMVYRQIYNMLRWKIVDNLPEGKSSAGMSTWKRRVAEGRWSRPYSPFWNRKLWTRIVRISQSLLFHSNTHIGVYEPLVWWIRQEKSTQKLHRHHWSNNNHLFRWCIDPPWICIAFFHAPKRIRMLAEILSVFECRAVKSYRHLLVRPSPDIAALQVALLKRSTPVDFLSKSSNLITTSYIPFRMNHFGQVPPMFVKVFNNYRWFSLNYRRNRFNILQSYTFRQSMDRIREYERQKCPQIEQSWRNNIFTHLGRY